MKVAILVNMMYKDLQDSIYEKIGFESMKYEETKEYIINTGSFAEQSWNVYHLGPVDVRCRVAKISVPLVAKSTL